MKKIIIFLSPLLLIIEITILNQILSLLNQPSDIAVFVGVGLGCVFLYLNYQLINFIIKQFKNQ